MARLVTLCALVTISYVVGCATDFYVEAQDALERSSHVNAENWLPLGHKSGIWSVTGVAREWREDSSPTWTENGCLIRWRIRLESHPRTERVAFRLSGAGNRQEVYYSRSSYKCTFCTTRLPVRRWKAWTWT